MLALLASLAVVVLQTSDLGFIHSSVQQANALLPDWGTWQVGRFILLAAGLGCWICPLLRRVPPTALGLTIGLILMIAGELIGRGLFYGLHMTVGMAIAG